MKRLPIAVLLTLFVASTAAAQTTPPPPPPTTPPPAGQKPTVPPPATQPKPTPPAPVPFPAEAKIGFVNMQIVVQESRFGKAGSERLKQLSEKRSADLQAKNKQAQALDSEIRTQATVMAASVLQGKQQELDRLQRQLQFETQQLQVDVDAMEAQLMNEFGEKVLPLVEEVRKEKGLWAVFTAGNGSNVAALMPGVDLSMEVVKKLDAVK